MYSGVFTAIVCRVGEMIVCVQWCPTHIVLCLFVVCDRLVTYVTNVASISGLSILENSRYMYMHYLLYCSAFQANTFA